MNAKIRWLLLPWALLLICPTAEGLLAIQEDSVEFVFSEQPRWAAGEGWQLSDSPQLAIGEGTDDQRYLFSNIFSFATRPRGPGYGRGPILLPDGQIVVGEPSSAEVLFFDASGRFVRTAVGKGEGPTELTYLRELHHCSPGMLVAVDGRPPLPALFLDGAGRFHGRSFLEANADRKLHMPITCNRNGQFLAMDYFGPEADAEERLQRLQNEQFVFYRNRVHIQLLDSEGYVIRDLGEFPGVERVDDHGPAGGLRSAPHPLGKTTALALGTNRAFIGTADDFEIQVWSLDGVLRQRWRRPGGDLSISEADFAAYDSVDPGVAMYLQELLRRLPTFPMPETYPAYTRFVLDATDYLWVEHFRTPRDKRHLWSVFTPDGAWLGEVEVPYTFEITDIGEDYVLGAYRDELDEESVRMYGLSRAS